VDRWIYNWSWNWNNDCWNFNQVFRIDRTERICPQCDHEVRLFAKYYGDLKTGEVDHIFPKSMGGIILKKIYNCYAFYATEKNTIGYIDGIHKNKKLG